MLPLSYQINVLASHDSNKLTRANKTTPKFLMIDISKYLSFFTLLNKIYIISTQVKDFLLIQTMRFYSKLFEKKIKIKSAQVPSLKYQPVKTGRKLGD